MRGYVDVCYICTAIIYNLKAKAGVVRCFVAGCTTNWAVDRGTPAAPPVTPAPTPVGSTQPLPLYHLNKERAARAEAVGRA